MLAALVLGSGCRGEPSRFGPEEITLAIRDVGVVDVEQGRTLRGRTVLVGGDRVLAVVESGRDDLPPGVETVDGKGRTLVPGLWDMHAHAWDRATFQGLYLAHGIVGIREMGTGMEGQYPGMGGVWSFRAEVDSGAAPGPRVIAAGAILEGGDSTWYRSVPFFRPVADSAAAARAVDSLAAAGADFVKVYRSLSPEAYAAIVAAAERHGLPVAGHVPFEVGAEAAAESGQRSIEHLDDLLVSASSLEGEIRRELAEARAGATSSGPVYAREAELRERILESFDPARARALVESFARNGTWHVPTLLTDADPRFDDPAAGLDSARLAELPSWMRRFIAPRGELEAEARRVGKAWLEKEMELVGALHRAGVGILAGSDAPNPFCYPGSGLHDELELLVRAGLTPAEALRAATLGPARYFGAEDSLGTVAAGKRADLVLLGGDPLDDIRNTRTIEAVIVGGRLFDRPALGPRVR